MAGEEVITILQRDAELLGSFLRQVLDAYRDAPKRLLEAIEYSLFSGGKRLRPGMVLESWRACGGPEESQQAALAAATGIELVHTFSLVHDDLPCMDDDDLRRGRPTSHKVFGEAVAILAGDAMLAMAFDVIVRHAPAPVAALLIQELARAAGPEGMIGGQVLDMAWEAGPISPQELQNIHRRKTGALFTAACRMGAITAGADERSLSAVTALGEHIGLAFQIIDDLLDVTSTPQQMGKATNKDAQRGKQTYPALLGAPSSRAEAMRHWEEARSAVAPMGARAEGLLRMARIIIDRTS